MSYPPNTFLTRESGARSTPEPPPAPMIQSHPSFVAPVVYQAWMDPDVHSWSQRMRDLIQAEFPHFKEQCLAFYHHFDVAVQEAKQQYAGAPGALSVLEKLVTRKRSMDADLAGVSLAGLFAMIWFKYVKEINDVDCYALLRDTLIDMGTTCLQGDTHRLFSIMVSLDRIMIERYSDKKK